MNFYILITYLPICLISFSLALFILFKGSKTRIEFLISTTLLSLSFWVFSLTIGDFSKNYKLALFWVNTAMLGPAILLGSMYLLLNAIIKSDKFLPKLFIILILAAPFFLLCYTPFNAKSIELHYWGSAVNPGILYDYFNVYALIIFFLGLFNLKNYKSFSENIKIIVKIMGIGFCVGVGTALITNNLLLVIFNISQLSIVGPFCALLVTVIIFLGLVKYELTDIQFVISKFLARMIIIFLILFTIISSFYIPGSKNISLILICFWGIF
jgi:hypothetical protein